MSLQKDTVHDLNWVKYEILNDTLLNEPLDWQPCLRLMMKGSEGGLFSHLTIFMSAMRTSHLLSDIDVKDKISNVDGGGGRFLSKS